MQTLEEMLIEDAPFGVSEQDCPGNFKVTIAKPMDGRPAKLWFSGKNDHPAVSGVYEIYAKTYIENKKKKMII